MDIPNPGTPSPTTSTPPETSGSSTASKVLKTLFVLLLLGSLGATGYFYKQYDDLKKNPNKAAQSETQATIDAVAKLIVLPIDEQPTLATVTEPEKLKDQAFFAHAKVGDKVLIYTNAKKAILYDPVANKIVEVAPITIGNNTDAQVSGTTTEKKE